MGQSGGQAHDPGPSAAGEPAEGLPAEGLPAEGLPAEGLPAEGLPAGLLPVAERAERAGIFLDFDGTLAPIVARPEDARAVEGARETLAVLADRFRMVAVVSGRAAADLARRIGVPGVRLVGLHGIEEHRDGRVHARPEAAALKEAVAAAAARIEDAIAGLEGVSVERKGLALSVHVRRAPDPDDAARRAEPLVRRVAAEAGLGVVPGRRVLELRPPGGDKGDAVRRLAREGDLEAALVAGDDVGDIPAFRAAAECGFAVRVAVTSDEAPAELLAEADLRVGSPADLVALLGRLA